MQKLTQVNLSTAVQLKKYQTLKLIEFLTHKFLRKFLVLLNAGQDSNIDSQTKQYFTKMVRDLYFQSLDERNARLSGAKRLNRAGYDKNMMRSLFLMQKQKPLLLLKWKTEQL